MKKHVWSIAGILGLLTVVFLWFWINRYQYEHAGVNQQMLVRINRFTGQQCFLTGEGVWNSRLTPDKWEQYAAFRIPDKCE